LRSIPWPELLEPAERGRTRDVLDLLVASFGAPEINGSEPRDSRKSGLLLHSDELVRLNSAGNGRRCSRSGRADVQSSRRFRIIETGVDGSNKGPANEISILGIEKTCDLGTESSCFVLGLGCRDIAEAACRDFDKSMSVPDIGVRIRVSGGEIGFASSGSIGTRRLIEFNVGWNVGWRIVRGRIMRWRVPHGRVVRR